MGLKIGTTKIGSPVKITIIENDLSVDDLASVNNPSGNLVANFATRIPKNGLRNRKGITGLSSTSITNIKEAALLGCSNLTTVSFPNVTVVESTAFQNCSSLTQISLPNATSIGNTSFKGCTNLTTALFPKITGMGGGTTFNSCPALSVLDLGFVTRLMGTAQFSGNNGSLNVLILHQNKQVPTMDGVGFFDNTAFASGGTGGTIYIPTVMYNHLNDGTNYDYMNNSNWATVYNYGNLTWAKLEGSVYDEQL